MGGENMEKLQLSPPSPSPPPPTFFITIYLSYFLK